MTPLEDEIRSVLRERCATVGPFEAYAAARTRARVIRRRRAAGGVGVGVVALAAAVAVPALLLGGGGGRARVLPSTGYTAVHPFATISPLAPTAAPRAFCSGTPQQCSPLTATTTVPVASTAAAASAGSRVATGGTPDAASWPFRGDQSVRTSLAPAAYAAARSAGVTPILALWAGSTPGGGWSGLVFRGRDGAGRPLLLTWLSSGGRARRVRDEPLPAGTYEVDQQLPADPANVVVVLGPPGSTVVLTTDGTTRSGTGVQLGSVGARGGAVRVTVTTSGRTAYDGPLTGPVPSA